MAVIKRIFAPCTRGKLIGVEFEAKADRSGRFVLNKKQPAHAKNPTNRAINKTYAPTLDAAAALLRSGDYLINLVAPNGVRALRSFDKVVIETV